MSQFPEMDAARAAGEADKRAGKPADPPSRKDLAAAYTDGYDSADVDPTPAPAEDEPAPKKPPAKKPASPGPKRRVARRRSTRRTSSARRVAGAVVAPGSRVNGPVTAFGLGLGLILLYQLLNDSDIVVGAVNGARAVIRWVNDPTTVIPYRKD